MFITFNKKNLSFSIGIIFSLITFIIYSISSKFSNKNNIILGSNQTTIEVSSLPYSNKTIILDAGHGSPDGGATSSNKKILESDLNLKIILKLQKLLEISNINVILTRSDENGIYSETAESIREKKISDMENRVKISENFSADLFLSIHMNSLENKSVNGFQVFYTTKNNNSKNCANYIHENLQYSISNFSNNKKIKEITNIYLAQKITLPFVLVECGFLSNNNEAELLNTESYQEKIAWGIYTGIIDYLSNIDK